MPLFIIASIIFATVIGTIINPFEKDKNEEIISDSFSYVKVRNGFMK